MVCFVRRLAGRDLGAVVMANPLFPTPRRMATVTGLVVPPVM